MITNFFYKLDIYIFLICSIVFVLKYKFSVISFIGATGFVTLFLTSGAALIKFKLIQYIFVINTFGELYGYSLVLAAIILAGKNSKKVND